MCQSTWKSFGDASEKCRVQYAGLYSDNLTISMGHSLESIKALVAELRKELMSLMSQLAMGCVTCHACHSCVTDFRLILGNPVEVTHVTSLGHVYIFPH